MIRATQITSMEFAPTQGGLSTHFPSSLSQNVSTSLLFSSTSAINPPDSGSQNTGTLAVEIGNLKLEKRFYKAQKEVEYQTRVFSKLAAKEKAKVEQSAKNRYAAAEGNVNLTRKYKIGDLPDIQITYSDLISPIIKMCQNSKECTEHLMVLLTTSIIQETQEMVQDGHFLLALRNIFSNVLKRSSASSKHFLSAIFKLLLSLPHSVRIDTNRILSLSSAAELGSLGILILEKLFNVSIIEWIEWT